MNNKEKRLQKETNAVIKDCDTLSNRTSCYYRYRDLIEFKLSNWNYIHLFRPMYYDRSRPHKIKCLNVSVVRIILQMAKLAVAEQFQFQEPTMIHFID